MCGYLYLKYLSYLNRPSLCITCYVKLQGDENNEFVAKYSLTNATVRFIGHLPFAML